MSKTIKISLIVLMLMAGFVVVRAVFLISKHLNVAIAKPTPIEVDYQDTNDWDNDGLSNSDESYWNTDPYNPDTDGDGFLDGEEVLSGFDPLKSSEGKTDDSLSEKSRLITSNLTEGVANLLVGGLFSGDLKRTADDATFGKSIDNIAVAAISDTLAVLEGIEVSGDDFMVVENSQENKENYVKKITEITEGELLDVIMKQPGDINRLFVYSPDIFNNPNSNEIKTVFLEHANTYQKAYLGLMATPVPQDALELHKNILTMIKKIETHYRSIALSGQDPLKMLIVMSNLQTIYIEAQSVLNKVNSYINSNNLTRPNNNLFNVIDELKNL